MNRVRIPCCARQITHSSPLFSLNKLSFFAWPSEKKEGIAAPLKAKKIEIVRSSENKNVPPGAPQVALHRPTVQN